jgi:hypothetical protein
MELDDDGARICTQNSSGEWIVRGKPDTLDNALGYCCVAIYRDINGKPRGNGNWSPRELLAKALRGEP